MIPKSRLDALTDGVFAFAMTLLVLDLRLPDTFHPASTAELLGGLRELSGQFLAYVISFFVLGIRWLAQAGAHGVRKLPAGATAAGCLSTCSSSPAFRSRPWSSGAMTILLRRPGSTPPT